MNTAIEQMLKNYQLENIYDQKNAMKEIDTRYKVAAPSTLNCFVTGTASNCMTMLTKIYMNNINFCFRITVIR